MGNVLICGGKTSADFEEATFLASAELYIAGSKLIIPVGAMANIRGFGHTATAVVQGSVIVAGGLCESGTVGAIESFFSPANLFSIVGSLLVPRYQHTATLLPNGNILFTGGSPDAEHATDSAEIFNPTTNASSFVGAMTMARMGHTATLLGPLPSYPLGAVLITGGLLLDGATSTATTEIFDIGAGTFEAAGDMTMTRNFHAAQLLATGKVLITRGQGFDGTAACDLFDPIAMGCSATGNLPSDMIFGCALAPLFDGSVLAVGADLEPVAPRAAIYDVPSGAWTAIAPPIVRSHHSATATLAGVVITGGYDASDELVSGQFLTLLPSNVFPGFPVGDRRAGFDKAGK
jgi:hypothetical protein